MIIIDLLIPVILSAIWFFNGKLYAENKQRQNYHRVLDEMIKDLEGMDIKEASEFDKLPQEEKIKLFERLQQHKGAFILFEKLLGLDKK